MRTGVRLGVDVGTVRVGVSRSDPLGLLATPVETVQRKRVDAAARVAELADEFSVVEIVVGLPVSLSGGDTRSTSDAREFAAQLAGGNVPVRLVDERLSTVSAQSHLTAAGRSAKGSRSVIDQAAATIILQHALDVERQSGRAPGEVLVSGNGAQ